jgi:dihydrofolate reductase
MAQLIYSAIASLDGFIEDADGNFDWAAPDEEVHAFVNDLERPVGTYLYGRRMYETMAVWDTMPLEGEPDVMRDFAEIWRAADKVVYSRTLADVSTRRTRLEPVLDMDAVRAMKRDSARDIGIGGPELAGQALAAGIVDELHLFLTPVLVGVGKHSLPPTAKLSLDLLDQRRFRNGTVFLRYGVITPG